LDITVWGVHAGRGGVAERLFLDEGLVALEASQMGDLKALHNDLEAFRERYSAAHAHIPSPRHVSAVVSQLFRFANELQVGDLVLYLSVPRKTLHLGEVIGEYQYLPSSEYPHRRRVSWRATRPSQALSDSARQELKSMLAIFKVRRHTSEVLALFS
jgi:restriction system protein